MNVTRNTNWVSGEILTASALNGEFNGLLAAPDIVDADIASGAAISPTKINATFPASGLIVGTTDTQTVSAKRITRRFVTVTQSATPAINSDTTDVASITGLAQAITSMTSSLTGTPNAGDFLEIQITDNATAHAITWGTSFESTTISLPTTTVISTLLRVLLEWNATASKWDCVAVV